VCPVHRLGQASAAWTVTLKNPMAGVFIKEVGECGRKISGERKWGDGCGRHLPNQNICFKSTSAKFALECLTNP
jgi:hypothetical protein